MLKTNKTKLSSIGLEPRLSGPHEQISLFFACFGDVNFDHFDQNSKTLLGMHRHKKRQTRYFALLYDNFVLFVFNILVCSAVFFSSRAQISRNRATLTYKSAKYRVCRLCLDSGGVHCVTFTATQITAQG